MNYWCLYIINQAGFLCLTCFSREDFHLYTTVDGNLQKIVYKIEQLHYIVPYFSAYKTEALPFQNNLKNLDPSYKMDLDL